MKVDLHIHSRYSERAPEWLFRRVGLAESYSEPKALYDSLCGRGMNLVTITDHHRIEGCLEIADRPGVFLSEQISARFPEDRCVVQMLVWGINEEEHRDLQEVRKNIYDLQKYMVNKQLAHAVAHPLYRFDDKFGLRHLEKLLLLFRHFEGMNGYRNGLLSEVTQETFRSLTREKLEEFANRHSLEPTHLEPWRKVFTGGSDDHGGIYAGMAYTEVQGSRGWEDFLNGVRKGDCTTGGRGGNPLTFSHSLNNNLRQFLNGKIGGVKGSKFFGKAFSRFMEGKDPTDLSWADKFGFIAEGLATGKIFELAKPANASLWKQFSRIFSDGDAKKRLALQMAVIVEPERRAFVVANFFVNQLAFRFFRTFIKEISNGNLLEAIREVSVLLPILAPLAPYFYAFCRQAPDRRWLREVSHGLGGVLPEGLGKEKRAWFTDTLEDVNGVANTIRKLTSASLEVGGRITVVTSRSTITITGIPIKNFEPIGEFELPEYELQKLSFPPVLEMIDYVEREGFTELIISTPGPIGLTALLAAKVLGVRTSGIYHTDFPQYVRILTDDNFLETLTWGYMKWFYDQLDRIYVNSEGYRDAWIDRGIDSAKIRILPRGLDTLLFHPSRRDEAFWVNRGVPVGQMVLLYVGRISKEKDLDVIVEAWEKMGVEASSKGMALAFVGEGPYLGALQGRLPQAVFTGVLVGLDLARAFASADVFLFPSTTDTFGNVIVEALASGVPCVVSDQGGPKDLIDHGTTGYITRGQDSGDFATHLLRLTGDAGLRRSMGEAARRSVEGRDWLEAGRAFWFGDLV